MSDTANEATETVFEYAGCVFMALVLGYGLVQIWAGYVGIEHHLGTGWAIAAVALVFLLRLTLPLTIGSFFCAINVWQWHWIGALVFAAPGLAYTAIMVPGVLASTVAMGRR